MSRSLFAAGCTGGIVTSIQQGLATAGFSPVSVDGNFGAATQTAVQRFQAARALAPTGLVDESTWQLLMDQPVPGTDERALQLTASIEGHGYSLAMGNWDGAWLTWGIVGFTLKSGSLTRLLRAIHEHAPECIRQAFGANSEALIKLITIGAAAQKRWADSITVGSRISEPWRTGFDVLGRFPVVQQEQRAMMHSNYFEPALMTARKFGLGSELGLALCFDIHVQNGGVSAKACSLIKKQSVKNEREMRTIIANAVADTSLLRFRDDVRARKLLFADGVGRVHDRNYELENWGLSEFAALELQQSNSTTAHS